MTRPTYVDDYNEIMAVLDKYNKGCAEANSSILKPAFSDRATIFGASEEGLTGGPIEFLYESIDKFSPSPNAKAVVVRLDIVGTVANARVDTNDLNGRFYTDFLNLVKRGNDWIIVSKIFHSHRVA